MGTNSRQCSPNPTRERLLFLRHSSNKEFLPHTSKYYRDQLSLYVNWSSLPRIGLYDLSIASGFVHLLCLNTGNMASQETFSREGSSITAFYRIAIYSNTTILIIHRDRSVFEFSYRKEYGTKLGINCTREES